MTDKRNKRLVLAFLFATVVLDAIGFGIIFPVMPQLIEEIADKGISDAAGIHGKLLLAFGLMQFLLGPIVGNLSDAYGRRAVLLFSLGGMIIDYVLMALAPTLAWLFFGRILGGITTATQATVNATIADISTDEDRTKNYGLVFAGFGIGFVLGPLIGGLLSAFGTRAPFWGAAIIALANLAFGFFVFRETLAPHLRRPFDIVRANPFGAFVVAFGKPLLVPFLIVWFVITLAGAVWPAILAFYANYQFGWSPLLVGLSLAGFGLSMAFMQAIAIRPLMNRFRARNLVLIGLIVDLMVFAAMSVIQNDLWVWLIFPAAAFATIATPAFTDLITRLVGSDEQGALQGLMASIGALTFTFGSLVMTQVFKFFTASERAIPFAGAPFVLSAFIMVVGIAIFAVYMTRLPTAQNAPSTGGLSQ